MTGLFLLVSLFVGAPQETLKDGAFLRCQEQFLIEMHPNITVDQVFTDYSDRFYLAIIEQLGLPQYKDRVKSYKLLERLGKKDPTKLFRLYIWVMERPLHKYEKVDPQIKETCVSLIYRISACPACQGLVYCPKCQGTGYIVSKEGLRQVCIECTAENNCQKCRDHPGMDQAIWGSVPRYYP